MAYAIMRTKKLRGAGSIAGSIAHAYRERETPNADPERTPDNEVLIQYDEDKCRNDIEKARTRSDNVEIIEVVLTTSPEFMETATEEQKAEWQERSIEYLEEEFGKDNIESAVVHNDETTKHVSAHVIPRDEKGQLNAKKWLGGKKKLQEIQDRYAEKLKDLGLERGERGSKAKHQEVAKYYSRIEKSISDFENTKEVKGLPAPHTAITGMYTRQEVHEHGLKVGAHVRDQMLEREKTLIAKVNELEARLQANRGNIARNQNLEKEVERLKPFEKFYKSTVELGKINPEIGKELKKAQEMKKQQLQQAKAISRNSQSRGGIGSIKAKFLNKEENER